MGGELSTEDAKQVQAAREGLGNERMLLVDAGTVWGDDVSQAEKRLPLTREWARFGWKSLLFAAPLKAYATLASLSGTVKLAGGEGCHNFHQAKNMIDYAGISYVQIDAGRIGGITTAKAVADYAAEQAVQFVNHTFTTPLALSASVQPYAGLVSIRCASFPPTLPPSRRNSLPRIWFLTKASSNFPTARALGSSLI